MTLAGDRAWVVIRGAPAENEIVGVYSSPALANEALRNETVPNGRESFAHVVWLDGGGPAASFPLWLVRWKRRNWKASGAELDIEISRILRQGRVPRDHGGAHDSVGHYFVEAPDEAEALAIAIARRALAFDKGALLPETGWEDDEP